MQGIHQQLALLFESTRHVSCAVRVWILGTDDWLRGTKQTLSGSVAARGRGSRAEMDMVIRPEHRATSSGGPWPDISKPDPDGPAAPAFFTQTFISLTGGMKAALSSPLAVMFSWKPKLTGNKVIGCSPNNKPRGRSACSAACNEVPK
ncbi:hypothetical protein EYF80_005919 [Liparis tanakae]|uniref:Uncharacterized protein n=1 Tax=Liparis tanakae TaxID=230148 RepID=A0A4Z2J2M8_9TELE|nr:hypothetical protein EYF80_005919 [Liparis tanakae]